VIGHTTLAAPSPRRGEAVAITCRAVCCVAVARDSPLPAVEAVAVRSGARAAARAAHGAGLALSRGVAGGFVVHASPGGEEHLAPERGPRASARWPQDRCKGFAAQRFVAGCLCKSGGGKEEQGTGNHPCFLHHILLSYCGGPFACTIRFYAQRG